MANQKQKASWKTAFSLNPTMAEDLKVVGTNALDKYSSYDKGQQGIKTRPNYHKSTAELLQAIEDDNSLLYAGKEQLRNLIKERKDPTVTIVHLEQGNASALVASKSPEGGAAHLAPYNVIIVNLTLMEKTRRVPMRDSGGKKYLSSMPLDEVIAHERQHQLDAVKPDYASLPQSCREEKAMAAENAYRRQKDKNAPIRYDYRDPALELEILLAENPSAQKVLADPNNMLPQTTYSRVVQLNKFLAIEQLNLGCKKPDPKVLLNMAACSLKNAGVSLAGVSVNYPTPTQIVTNNEGKGTPVVCAR